MIDNDRQ